jgi:hypothetical protein
MGGVPYHHKAIAATAPAAITARTGTGWALLATCARGGSAVLKAGIADEAAVGMNQVSGTDLTRRCKQLQHFL